MHIWFNKPWYVATSVTFDPLWLWLRSQY